MENERVEKVFRGELRRLLAGTIAFRLASGLVAFLAVSGWLFLLLCLWTALRHQPPLWQAVLMRDIFLLLVSLGFAALVVVPLVRMPRLGKLASEIEHREDFKDLVVAAFEFSRDEKAKERYDAQLVAEVVRRALAAVRPLQTRFLFLGGRELTFVPLAYGSLVLLLLLALVRPEPLIGALALMADPGRSAARVHEANILVSPGDVTVLAGTDVEVTGVDFGGSKLPVNIHFSRGGGFWKSERAKRDAIETEHSTLSRYSYLFKGTRTSLSYYFQAGDRKTPTYKVTVVNKPIVTWMRVVRRPPPYTGEKPDTLDDGGGNIQALEGTKVTVEGRSNNQLVRAEAGFASDRAFHDEKRKGAAFSGNGFRFEFDALHDCFYRILLEDTLGLVNDDPLVYTVRTYQDNPPTIDVIAPGGDATMPASQKIDVAFVAGDDYGVARAGLFYRKGSEGSFDKTNVPLGDQKGKREVAKAFLWDLSGMKLFPGNVVEYYVEVADNNTVTGPGVTRSRVYQIMVPTMAELYDRVAEEGQMREDLLEESLKEGEELKKRLEKLSREFKKTETLDWSQKKEVDKAVEQHKKIEEALEEVKSSLQRTLEELSENKMTSQAIGEKMEEISKLLEQVKSEALDKYMESLKEAVSKLNKKDISEALRNLTMNAEDLLQRLERTAELLRQLRKEQNMEELVRKSRELMEKQKDLLDETEATAAGDQEKLGRLGDKQKDLAEEASGMREDIEAMKEMLDEGEKEIASMLESSSNRMAQNRVADKMTKASESLKASRRNQALEEQKDALNDLISLFTSMSSCQAAMGRSAGQKLALNLQKYARKTLEVSFKQEELVGELSAFRKNGGSLSGQRSLAEKQLAYMKATEKIANDVFDIAKKTLAVPPVLIKALGDALRAMEQSIFNLENNRSFYSLPASARAVASLNRATIEMLRAAKSCASGAGKSMGLQDMLRQLLSGEQEILEQSKEMVAMQILKERMRMERQAKLRRLAATQRSLKELAEELNRQLELEEKAATGRMDKIIEEMEEVARRLEGGNLDERTLDHEERILSRLLDAQRSIHTRDYERKRESITAEDVFSRPGGKLDKDTPARTLREEIRRAMKLKAPGEFEELIRSYFRALAEEETSGKVDSR